MVVRKFGSPAPCVPDKASKALSQQPSKHVERSFPLDASNKHPLLMSTSKIAVSAPGKVLFTGGFLVLDRKHTGLVFGLNARIHVHVEAWQGQGVNLTSQQKDVDGIVFVQSPQFRDAKWLYIIDATKTIDDEAVHVKQVVELDEYTKSRNKFVEITLQYCLTYFRHLSKDIHKSLKITILADNDYYSQSLSKSAATVKNGFTDFGVALADAHKTGLGSSAALVTALVSSLLMYYSGNNDLPQKTIHNLAQAAHCAAQGKVGSGFDIAAAVFGSCLYKRFTPSILERIGEPASSGFGERLHRCVEDLDLEQKWDVEVSSQAVRIPDDLLLVMCDVDCGSETPGLVRKVLQWRKEKPVEANLLWTAIQQGSQDLCAQLQRMSDVFGVTTEGMRELGDIIQTIRSLVREMSRKSGVPIEPDVITELLDFCTKLPGVIGGVAPGAGGYDAVALLLKNDVKVVEDLQARLEGWTSKDQSSEAQIGRVRLLGVKQEKEGVRVEKVDRYYDWL